MRSIKVAYFRRERMSKLHYTKYQENYKNYILDCIDSEDDLINKELTKEEKIKYLFDRFYSEYGFMVERVGKQKAIAEWLSGLAIHIPYTHNDIIELAKNMGSVNQNLSTVQEDRIIENYFNFMAYMVLLLEDEIKEVA
tara:strand:+ start:2046 stop:2462 length:417 start_codon:yes stop_codon:yes gene_type:complete